MCFFRHLDSAAPCSIHHTSRLTRRARLAQVINGIGSVTFLGGSTPDPRVEAAMEAANGSFVPMDDLQKKVGVAIGDMIDNVNGAGAYPTRALVTSGCAGAMTLASAAAMAGTDPAKIIQLPDTAGMPCDRTFVSAADLPPGADVAAPARDCWSFEY